jgi:membrane-bound lytic murein transglycosylase D
VLAVAPAWGETDQRRPDPEAGRLDALFPRPPALAKNVRFWKQIFTTYSGRQVVVHDARYVDKVYSVLDLGAASERTVKTVTAAEKERIRSILLRLHTLGPDPRGLTAGERTVFDLFRDVKERNKFLAAAEPKRLRAQRGLRERFADGIRVSRRYLPAMERIFHAEGLPVELTRLPLIESCFNVEAYSWAGAAGVWQFMPAAGRLHMLRIDRVVDERRDPILSTRAAADYLGRAYRRLGSWPLAITAYNHGPDGIARAVRTVGSTDIADLVARYDGRTWGFASKNFYAEFLAALDVDGRYRDHFGDLPVEEPIPTQEVRLAQPLGIEVAARAAGVDRQTLAELNPALSTQVIRGAAYVPRGYHLRLPAGTRDGFQRRLVEVATPADSAEVVAAAVLPLPKRGASAARQRPAQRASYRTHRVRPGQTLSHIAQQYGTTIAALKTHNAIRNERRLRPGQVIKIPAG